MSLYRQSGGTSRRTLLLVAGALLLVGLLAGFGLGRLTAPDPSLADKVAELRTALEPADQGLELTATEYGQAVRGGRVIAATEYAAARADVERVKDALATSRADLRALNPSGAAALESAIRTVDADVARRADPAEVRASSDAARRALSELLPR
jgi:hypothetical protein